MGAGACGSPAGSPGGGRRGRRGGWPRPGTGPSGGRRGGGAAGPGRPGRSRRRPGGSPWGSAGRVGPSPGRVRGTGGGAAAPAGRAWPSRRPPGPSSSRRAGIGRVASPAAGWAASRGAPPPEPVVGLAAPPGPGRSAVRVLPGGSAARRRVLEPRRGHRAARRPRGSGPLLAGAASSGASSRRGLLVRHALPPGRPRGPGGSWGAGASARASRRVAGGAGGSSRGGGGGWVGGPRRHARRRFDGGDRNWGGAAGAVAGTGHRRVGRGRGGRGAAAAERRARGTLGPAQDHLGWGRMGCGNGGLVAGLVHPRFVGGSTMPSIKLDGHHRGRPQTFCAREKRRLPLPPTNGRERTGTSLRASRALGHGDQVPRDAPGTAGSGVIAAGPHRRMAWRKTVQESARTHKVRQRRVYRWRRMWTFSSSPTARNVATRDDPP